ncbi:MAG: DUF4493 domain-containing protein [Rikenellaceae bacterium]
MKSTLKFLMIFLAVVTLSTGCSGDDTSFKYPENTVDPDGIIDPNSEGYLSFDSFSLSVEVQTEVFKDEPSDVVGISRATDESSTVDASEFTVQITRESDEEVVYNDTYANTLAVSSPLILSAGAYNVDVFSCEESEIALAGWDCPEYSGSKRYVVGDEKVTSVGDITCTLANVMTSVSMSMDLIDLFDTNPEDEDYKLHIILSVDGNELSFDPTQSQIGYFKAPSNSKMNINLVGKYNITPDDDTATYMAISKGDWEQEISGVKAGQYRNVSVKIKHNEAGSVLVKYEISTWAYDEEIDVDITSQLFITLMEDVIFDPDDETSTPNSPVVTLDSVDDVSSTVVVSTSILDTFTETYSPTYKTYITPYTGSTVESVDITVTSTNAEIASLLQGYGFSDEGKITLYEGGVFVADAISGLISMGKDSETDVVIGAIKYNGMVALCQYIGVHSIKVVATDSQNRISYTTLSIETVSAADAPQIIWEGYDFNTRYELFTSTTDGENPVVDLVITSVATKGISSLIVTIDSEVLTEEFLEDKEEGVGIPASMDLINIIETDSVAAKTIQGFGLPVGDEISGKNELILSISEFMPLLAGLGAGKTDFIIEVGDSFGTTRRVIMVEKK